MKTLIVYYSRTNVTKDLCLKVQSKLNCDIEEITETKNRDGALNYLKSCLDAIRGTKTDIKPTKNDPSNYDLVIIASPVWAGTMANPVLTYLNQNNSKFPKIALVSTCGGDCTGALMKMSENIGKEPIATLTRKNGENADLKIEDFVKSLN